MAAVDETGRFPWRGLLLGALLIPPTTLFGVYTYIVAQATLWTQTSLLRGPIFVLCGLTLLNLLLRRLRLRWGLSQHDLLLVYAMQCVATAVGGIGWCQFVVPSLGSATYYATAENRFADFQELIPAAFKIADPDVINALYRGHSTLYSAANWQAVAKPFLFWTVLMALLAVMALGLAQLLREQWVSRERLTFPLTYLPLEMSRDGGAPAFWSNRLLWVGFGLAAFIDCVNGLHFLIPAVPEILVKPVGGLRIDAAWSSRELSALKPFVLSFYPFMIGIGFLLTLDVAFSAWAWYLITKLISLLAVTSGLADGPLKTAVFPFWLEQGVGAFLGLAVLAVWRSRHDFAAALRPGQPASRNLLLALLLAGAVVTWLVGLLGLPSGLTVVWLLLYLAYSIGCARIVSETGSGWTFAPGITPHTVLLRAPGAPMLNPRQATVFANLMPLDLDFRDAVLPQFLQSMRLSPDDGGRRHPLLWGLCLALLLGIAAGLWAHLHVYFQYGVDSALTRRWPAQVGRQPFDMLANQLKGNLPGAYAPGGVVFGGLAFAALVAARTHLLWWPLHPVGYALACTQSMDYLWLPFLIAWALKSAALRFGGMKLYRRLLPFFLGLILGDYVVPLLWAVYGTITGTQQYLSFPH
ncbi:MAG: hypothetical protein IT204_17970 [Fimbriimonadaceae bacterium]|nr:hypothetical protein [Fimbriimonadaceae bacterium]